MDVIAQTLQFIRDPQNTFLQHTESFLVLCAVAVALAILVAIPLGVVVARRPVLAFLASNISGLMRAVPTLVFLALALPYLGIGFEPTVIALAVLGIPPILLNTVAGLRGIDPAAIEAARGMGMTPWQVLARVQLPLVLPVLAAGVRTSAVQIVATAPLGALIGAGGYGDYILAGVNLLQTPPLLAGAVPVAVLALLLEIALAGVQRALTPAGLRAGQPPAEARTLETAPATPAEAPVTA